MINRMVWGWGGFAWSQSQLGALEPRPQTTLARPSLVPVCLRNTRIVARNHYSQIASHEGALSRGELNLSWAIMGHHGPSWGISDY